MEIAELYRFVRGSEIWTYTSSSVGISYGGETYEPIPIVRSEIELKNEISKNGLTITTDLVNDLAADLIGPLTNARLAVTVYKREDADFSVIWKGRLVNAKPVKSTLKMDFESIVTVLSRAGLRPKVQKTCWKALYSVPCGVLATSFQTAGTVTGISGNVVTVDSADTQSDGYYDGGIILEAVTGKLFFVISHTGENLTVQGSLSGLAVSDSVYIYPGCNKTTQTCLDKFSNLPNFGGFPWIPRKNIMDGKTKV